MNRLDHADPYAVSIIRSSRVRQRIIHALLNGARTPTDICTYQRPWLWQSSVSRELRPLVQEGIIVCLTPKRRKGRLHQVTEKGRATWSEYQRDSARSRMSR